MNFQSKILLFRDALCSIMLYHFQKILLLCAGFAFPFQPNTQVYFAMMQLQKNIVVTKGLRSFIPMEITCAREKRKNKSN